MDSFAWSQSEFSEFFHLKRVTNESMFVDVWREFVAPSLGESSGVYNINKKESQQSADPTTARTLPPTSECTVSIGGERKTSRKRKAENETPRRTLPPSLRPIRVVSTTEESCSKDKQTTNQAMDEAIEKAFVGKPSVIYLHIIHILRCEIRELNCTKHVLLQFVTREFPIVYRKQILHVYV